MTEIAAEVLGRPGDPKDLVFCGPSGGRLSTSSAKAALDVASGVTGWWLHDLRRTAATLRPTPSRRLTRTRSTSGSCTPAAALGQIPACASAFGDARCSKGLATGARRDHRPRCFLDRAQAGGWPMMRRWKRPDEAPYPYCTGQGAVSTPTMALSRYR